MIARALARAQRTALVHAQLSMDQTQIRRRSCTHQTRSGRFQDMLGAIARPESELTHTCAQLTYEMAIWNPYLLSLFGILYRLHIEISRYLGRLIIP